MMAVLGPICMRVLFPGDVILGSADPRTQSGTGSVVLEFGREADAYATWPWSSSSARQTSGAESKGFLRLQALTSFFSAT